MNFLAAVNRMLRINTIIKGDDDALASFAETQHAANTNLAQISVQSELQSLVANSIIPYEYKTTGSLTTVDGTRVYAVASNFIRFYGDDPFLMDADGNHIYEYRGGLQQVRHDYPRYKDTAVSKGSVNYWYWELGTTKQIALLMIPNSVKTWTYDFEADVNVVNTTDVLPFIHENEAQAFVDMAAVRLKFLIAKKPTGKLHEDATWSDAKIRLLDLMGYKNIPRRYGNSYH